MPYSIVYIEKEEGLIISWEGQVNGIEVIRSYQERFSPPERLVKLRYIITDYSATPSFEVSPKDILTIAHIANQASEKNHQIYGAAIMPTELQFGMARMWQAYADDDRTGWETIVTRTRKEAEDWLRQHLDSTLVFQNK
jgi:hypothetical protein